MSLAAAGIRIGEIDKLADRAATIAGNVSRNPLGYSDNFSIYHQHPVITTFHVPLDDHGAVTLTRLSPCCSDVLLAVEAARDPPALVPGKWLEDDGKSNFPCCLDGSLHVTSDRACRHGETDSVKHAFGEVLVLRYVRRDDAGGVARGCLNAAEVSAESQLDEGAGTQPTNRNPTALGLFDDDAGGWPKSAVLPQVAKLLKHLSRIDRLSPEAAPDQRGSVANACEAELLFFVLDDHPPQPRLAGLKSPAELHIVTGQRLQLKSQVLQHMRPPRPLLQALDESPFASSRAWVIVQRGERFE